MSVWFVIPSKRPLPEASICLEAWKDMGYCTAILREPCDDRPATADICLPVREYLGWPRSVNLLVATAMAGSWSSRSLPDPEWFVTGGDDYFPDPNKRADEIANECREYFAGRGPAKRFDASTVEMTVDAFELSRTFGVMQPTGDRWGERNGIATIDHIAGSPWMGREFCRRMYHGAGPLYNGFYHNFADEHLQRVAEKLGVFWQRRDLKQEHRHWARPRGDWRDAPDWAHKINNPQLSDWDRSKALFKKLEAGDFREAYDLLPE